jgi:FeS assembly SUF system protein
MRLFRRKNDEAAREREVVKPAVEVARPEPARAEAPPAPAPERVTPETPAVPPERNAPSPASDSPVYPPRSGGAPVTPLPADAPPAATRGPEGSIADAMRVPSHARDTDDMDAGRRAIVDTLRSIYDPEIPVNIYDIGLIYDIDQQPDGDVKIRMTLTSPMCPVAETLPPEVESKVASVEGVRNVQIDLVWEPPWTPAMMSEDARLLLNMM